MLIYRLHEIGYETCIISNNKEERVKPLADEVDSKYVSKANKPSPVNYIKAMDIMNCGKDNVFHLGSAGITEHFLPVRQIRKRGSAPPNTF